MREYLMTEEQLQEHGYPRPNPDRPGGAIVHTAAEKKVLDREYRPLENSI